jgi:hypothetical protein
MPGLQTGQPLSTTLQPVSDGTGVVSALSMSTTSVGIGTPLPEVALHVAGDLRLEYNGSPRLTLFAHGHGQQEYSIRATNAADDAGGRLLVFRDESHEQDIMVLDDSGNLRLERNGSPKLILFAHGTGQQEYSIRATNAADDAGGRLLVFRNESHGQDIIVIDNLGNVSFAGDITLTGADCAEQFKVDGDECDPGSVMVIATQETLRCCTEPYDRRVAGVISGASARQPGLTLGGGIRSDLTRPLALSGTVFCKADATVEPVSVGDLLTTSATPGHAMKASDRSQAFGCVLGKALGELSEGVGLIPILVTLN